MNNLPLKPLKWVFGNKYYVAATRSPTHEYSITEDDGKFTVEKIRLETMKKEYATGFSSLTDAQEFAQSDFEVKMQPYVKPDSITDIANWFKAAKPEPNNKDIGTQAGCLLEEVVELLEGFGFAKQGAVLALHNLAGLFKANTFEDEIAALTQGDRIEIVDACCDINVTSVGVMQLLGGVDVLGAQREVIRSNNSKMVNGKFEFDANGKIAKPDSYSEPDLTPFAK